MAIGNATLCEPKKCPNGLFLCSCDDIDGVGEAIAGLGEALDILADI